MPRRFVNEITDGETIEETFVLADKQLRANRNGDTYLLADLRGAWLEIANVATETA